MRRSAVMLSCILLICALALPVFAAGSSVSLTPSETQVHRGDTFTVEAHLDNSDAIVLCTVVLSYDETVLEMTGGTCDLDDPTFAQVIPDKKAGTCMLTLKAVSGKAFTFEFKVRDDAPLGACSITARAAIGVTSGKDIDATGTSVTVACDHVPGPAATADTAQTCTACGAELAPALGDPEPTEQSEAPATGQTQSTESSTATTQAAETTGTESTVQTTGQAQTSNPATEQTAAPAPLPTGTEPGETVLLLAAVPVLAVAALVVFFVLRKKKKQE